MKRTRSIVLSMRMAIFGVVSFCTLFEGAYACLEPTVFMEYPAGGPTIGVRVVLPLNWRKYARMMRPTTLIGVKRSGQPLLFVLNVPPGEQKFLNLKRLTLSDAQELWGKATIDAGETKTFDLMRPLAESIDYHIDAKFKDQKLISYRIRGPEFQNPVWTQPSDAFPVLKNERRSPAKDSP